MTKPLFFRFALSCCAAFLISNGTIRATWATPDCRFGRDYPTDLRCYLAQFPGAECYDPYFGFSGRPDYPKALRCFENHKTWPYLVVIYLNGQGASRDVQKAEQWFATGQKTGPVEWPDEWTADQVSKLKLAIENAKGGPNQNRTPVVLCSDVLGGTTPEIDFCTAIDELVRERKLAEMTAVIRAELKPADVLLFDKVVADFRAYQEADSNRAYEAWQGGTIRNIRRMDQAKLVRDDFRGLIEKTIQRRDLESADKLAYHTADAMLNRVYRDDLHGADAEYRKTARTGELDWLRYRDSWTELAISLYRGRTNDFDPGLSMETAVTKLRVQELRNAQQP